MKKKVLVIAPQPRSPVILEKTIIDPLLELFPHEEIHLNMGSREYLALRVGQLEEFGGIKNQQLSQYCGWSGAQLYTLYSSTLKTVPPRKPPKASWRHAARLMYVTHGFIHAKYLNPEYWLYHQRLQVIETGKIG